MHQRAQYNSSSDFANWKSPKAPQHTHTHTHCDHPHPIKSTMTITMMTAPPPSGIGRRRGAASKKKSPFISIIVATSSFLLTFLFILSYGSYNNFSSSSLPGKNHLDVDSPTESSEKDDDDNNNVEESNKHIPKEFRDVEDIVRANLHLVSIQTDGIASISGSSGYHGVTGSFCKLNWNKYKKDPPSLSMFRLLVRQN